jgi:hypothetical protein
VLANAEFCNFLDTFDKKQKEKQIWEFYIHKLPAWDARTFDEFKHDVLADVEPVQAPAKEELEATVQNSYVIMQNFQMEGG